MPSKRLKQESSVVTVWFQLGREGHELDGFGGQRCFSITCCAVAYPWHCYERRDESAASFLENQWWLTRPTSVLSFDGAGNHRPKTPNVVKDVIT